MSLSNQIKQLIKHIDAFQRLLSDYAHPYSFDLHVNIDQYYYIQKIVELELLLNALRAHRLDEEIVAKHYQDVYRQWQEDAQSFDAYLNRLDKN